MKKPKPPCLKCKHNEDCPVYKEHGMWITKCREFEEE